MKRIGYAKEGTDMEWIQQNWEAVAIVYLLGVKFITGIRDAFDKTPASDDNLFERICTILQKTIAYIVIGQRPK